MREESSAVPLLNSACRSSKTTARDETGDDPVERRQTPILMYHRVTETGESSRRGRSTNPVYTIGVEQFRRQMHCVSENGYRSLSLYDFMESGHITGESGVVITFDDGRAEVYGNALEILAESNLTATVFVITGSVGTAGFAGWDQLREMSAVGISIQSHAESHRPLTTLSTERLMHEMEASKKNIEDHVGHPVDFLSVPHGMIDLRVREAAREAGYRAVCTSEPGFSHCFGNPAVLCRVNVPGRCSPRWFKNVIAARSSSLLGQIVIKKLKNAAKGIVGYRNYRRFYELRYRIRA
jgi:peptidoglycan/xylan/chitin deacetylase (PgdA/CDA1 family)